MIAMDKNLVTLMYVDPSMMMLNLLCRMSAARSLLKCGYSTFFNNDAHLVRFMR